MQYDQVCTVGQQTDFMKPVENRAVLTERPVQNPESCLPGGNGRTES